MARGELKTKKKKLPPWLAWLRITVMLVIIIAGFAGWRTCYWNTTPTNSQLVVLEKVIDGDTIRVRNLRGEELKVRLIGIDTPELGTAASFRSALKTAELLESARAIRLEPDPKTPRDKYDRVLGWVFYETEDGREHLLQEEIVRSGLADLYRDAAGSKYYARLELAARYQKR
jgi:micrococcal nuclease